MKEESSLDYINNILTATFTFIRILSIKCTVYNRRILKYYHKIVIITFEIEFEKKMQS